MKGKKDFLGKNVRLDAENEDFQVYNKIIIKTYGHTTSLNFRHVIQISQSLRRVGKRN